MRSNPPSLSSRAEPVRVVDARLELSPMVAAARLGLELELEPELVGTTDGKSELIRGPECRAGSGNVPA